MSNPESNLEKEKQRHKVPLMGMGGLLALVAVALVVFVLIQIGRGDAPEGAEVQVELPTGDTVQTD